MQSRGLIIALSGVLLITVISGACVAGFFFGQSVSLLPDNLLGFMQDRGQDQTYQELPLDGSDAEGLAAAAETPEELAKLFAPFWETWEIVHDRYVDQPLDEKLLLQGAIQGMVDSIGDPHTSYMTPDQYMQSNIPLDGEYQGIGAWVDPEGDYLTIVSPMPDSPAEKAGLKPGDQIIAVDGEDMTGIDGSLVIRRVMGPDGSKVILTILREDESEPIDFELVRARISIPSLNSEILAGDIAYLQLFQFGDNGGRDVRDALKDLLDENPTGLILDLRNNGGGFLHTAIDITSEFIAEGVVAYEEYGDGRQETLRAQRGGLATEIPLVVLMNEGSASASEILAGAIQDYERGVLVGTTSFGKGSVQSVSPLSDDQGAVRVTIALWLTPNERQINGLGLEPDVEVLVTEEDIEAERDPQLDKAIEILTNDSL